MKTVKPDKRPMTPQNQTDFLTTRDAAKRLGLSLTTIQLWVEAGVLPAWKTTGGHRRIPRAAIEELLEQQRKIMPERQPRLPTVLLVEDDPVERMVYHKKFDSMKLPINLVLAEDGFHGLIEIGRQTPAVVLTDLRMPSMDGFEMIRRILALKQELIGAIVVVTGLKPREVQKGGRLPNFIPVYE
jgi:excisionase family DNA binding protein